MELLSSDPANIVQVRELLKAKFPELRVVPQEPVSAKTPWATGVPQIDGLSQGGLSAGAITELVVARKAAGFGLVLNCLLRSACESRRSLALVDATDGFDPGSAEEAWLSALLWVRCHNALEALRACDILARDRNVSLIVLDLHRVSPSEVRRVSATVWFRFQRILEEGTASLLAVTSEAMVGSAQVRISLEGHFLLEGLQQETPALLRQVQFVLHRAPWLKQADSRRIAEVG